MTTYFTDPIGQSIVSSFQRLGLALNSIESNNSDFEKFDVQAILAESLKHSNSNSNSSNQPAVRVASEKHDMSVVLSGDSDNDDDDADNEEDGSFYSTNESSINSNNKNNSIQTITSHTGKNNLNQKRLNNDNVHQIIDHLKQKSVYETGSSNNNNNNNNNNNKINGEDETEEFDSLMKLGANISKQLVEDEWVDDDDNGYVLITISTEEFFEMEEACAGRMVYEEELKQETDTWLATATTTSNTTSSNSSSSSSSSSSMQVLPNTVTSFSFGMTPRDANNNGSGPGSDCSSFPPYTARSVDSQGAPSEFNQYYAGMYDDLQAAKAALDDSGEVNNNTNISNKSKKNNEGEDDDDDDDMVPSSLSLHTAPNELLLENPHASVRYFNKDDIDAIRAQAVVGGTERLVDSNNNHTEATTAINSSNTNDEDLDGEQRIELELQSQKLSSRRQQHVFNTSAMMNSGKESDVKIAGISSSNSSNNINSNSAGSNNNKESDGNNNSKNISDTTTANNNKNSNITGSSSNVNGITNISHSNNSSAKAASKMTRRLSQGEIRRSEIMGQNRFQGADNKSHSYFNLKVIFEPNKTGFEEQKHFAPIKGTIIAGRYEVSDVLGTAAFSTALQCADLIAEENEPKWVCLKVIKNNKDFFDQSMDEIKLLQYINSHCEPDEKHILRLIDFFYYKEHLFIVSELLRENLYEFGRYVREEGLEPYYTLPRLKLIMKQILEALVYIHSLGLIHCDVKPENIVVKSYSRCEVKLIDFGSSCFTTDNLTTYIQSRSYRAPEVIIGHPYDGRIDIWSMGAVLAELYTGYVLFQNDSVPTMLARIAGVLGPIPHQVLMNGKETYKYYTSSSVVYEKAEEQTVSLVYPKHTTLEARLHFDTSSMEADDVLFIDFTRKLLDLDPLQRPTAEEALTHAWFHDIDQLTIPPPKLTHPTAPAV